MARYAVSLQVGLTILAVLLLLLLQGILILLALSDAQLGGGAAAAVGVDNYWAMVRSFEFRRALANTLWVLAMALVIIVPALGIVMRLGEQSRRLRVLVLVAVIVPLAMPGALGALAWRSTLEVLHIPLDRRWVALPVFALVQAWRAFPLAVAVRTAPLRRHQRTRAGLAGAVAAYWIVADVSVVMLLTGGAPANATHVLASWGYVTAVTGGQIGLGAAMEMTLLVVLRLLGIALGWLGVQLLLQRADGVTPPAPASADLAASRPAWRAWTALTVLLLWLLTPLLVVVIQAGWPWAWGAPLRVLIATSGYVWWLGGTLLLAAGAGLGAVDRLDAGAADVAFVAVRPPGHHATPTRPMGFCLVNNVAVTAASLAARGARVAVVDVDAHHGNGTQDAFYADPRVLFVSFHEWPLYPGTGALDDVGRGDGLGTTINVPLPAGATGDVYRTAIDEIVGPLVAAHGADWLLVSAGFDAHVRDPLTGLALTSADYAAIMASLVSLVPAGRTVAFLEGGYDLPALEACVGATLARLAERRVVLEDESAHGPGHPVIQAVRRTREALGLPLG